MARSITHPSTDRQNRMIFIGAIGLAALAAVLVFASLSGFGSGGGGSPASLGATMDVVVASRDINPGDKITRDMVEIATLPKNAVITGAITDKTGLDGLTARYPLAKGDQLSAAKLGQTDKGKTFSNVIPAGRRAVAVDVEEKTSVGGLIVAGDHVDVIVIGKAVTKDANGQGLPASFTLLQDIEVLSVAQNSQEPVARLDKDGKPITTDTAAGAIASRPSDTSATPKAKTVTLSVTPEEAARLALAAQSYSIYLSARAPGDDSKIDNPDQLQQLPDVQ